MRVGDRVRVLTTKEEGDVVSMRRELTRSGGFAAWPAGRRPHPPRWMITVRHEDGRQWHYWADQVEEVVRR